jgi:hypothetical protein
MGAPVRSTSEARGVPQEPNRTVATPPTLPAERSPLAKRGISQPVSAADNAQPK